MTSGVPAGKRLIGIALLFFFILLLFAQDTAALSDEEIAVTQKGIDIEFHDRTLGEVLSHIQQVSGIRFSLPTAIGMTPVTATVHARDWPSTVRELLRHYNTAEVWDKTQLTKVYILERGTAANVSEEPASALEGDGHKPEITETPEPPPASSLPPPPPPPPMDTEGPTFERR